MRMSTKGRFAVNAMIDLALREHDGPVALAAVAARQQVSLSYLEQLFSRLRKNGLVHSTRGPGGGYSLGRDATQISVADVVLSVEEGESDEHDVRSAQLAGALWANVQEVMLRHLATISLRSLAEKQRAGGYVAETKVARRAISAATTTPALRTLRSSAPNSVFAFGQSFIR